jgi:IS5 family transposase
VNDRRSFEEFVGLGVMNSIPDATTVAFFRERLRKAELIEELFEMFEANLRPQGLQARGGQISGLLSGCKSLPAKRAPGGSLLILVLLVFGEIPNHSRLSGNR